jgi:hypothetical protein
MTQQYPPQGYGEYPPQGQPWQPQQYDPQLHQQRFSATPQQADMPQGQPWAQPGYGQPPSAPQSPQQPQPHKSWPARHKVLTGFMVFGGLVVVGGIVSAAGGSGSASPSAPGGAVQTAAAPAATQAANQPAAPASSAAAVKPQLVATFSGSGIQNTPRFTVSSTWKLDYSFSCSSFGSAGNFQVYEDGGNDFGGVSVNDLAMSKTSSTWAYNDGGTHYLEINSECDWTVKILDEE